MSFHAEGKERTARRSSRPGRPGARGPRVRRPEMCRLVPVRVDRRVAAHQTQTRLPRVARCPTGLADHVLLRRPRPPPQRSSLHRALQEIARLGGGTVESYPEDAADRSVSSSFLHNGTVSMFERHGFERTRRLGKNHWVVTRTVPTEYRAWPMHRAGCVEPLDFPAGPHPVRAGRWHDGSYSGRHGTQGFTHAGGTGNNTASWQAALSVRAPQDSVAGTYTGTVTFGGIARKPGSSYWVLTAVCRLATVGVTGFCRPCPLVTAALLRPRAALISVVRSRDGESD